MNCQDERCAYLIFLEDSKENQDMEGELLLLACLNY